MLEQRLRNLPKRLDLVNTANTIIYQQQQIFYQQPSQFSTQPYTFNQQQSSSIIQNYDLSQIIKLKDCNPKEIIHITKNRVLKQTQIKVPIVLRPKSAFSVRPIQKQVISESEKNEQLFNYQKIVKQRNAKKQKFLSQIQRKIQLAEQQAQQLQKQFKGQQYQLKEIQILQQKLKDQFDNQLVNEQVGKLQKQIEQKEKRKQHQKIELAMQVDQIKRVIQNQAQLDRQIIDEADDLIARIRGSKQKQSHIQKTKQKPPKAPQKSVAPVVSSFSSTRRKN